MWAYALGNNPSERYEKVKQKMPIIILVTWLIVLALGGGMIAAAILDSTEQFDCRKGFFDDISVVRGGGG